MTMFTTRRAITDGVTVPLLYMDALNQDEFI
jgi:hypothetical protein